MKKRFVVPVQIHFLLKKYRGHFLKKLFLHSMIQVLQQSNYPNRFRYYQN